MSTNGVVNIPLFNGENYRSWKKRVSLFLKLISCEDVIERSKQEEDKEEWDEKDLKAMNYIYSAIADSQIEFVFEETTAYDIINKFDSLYLEESNAKQILCRDKLERLRFQDYNDMATFFTEFEESVNELKNAGAKVSEKEKLNYMLNTLPDLMAEYIYQKCKIQMAEFANLIMFADFEKSVNESINAGETVSETHDTSLDEMDEFEECENQITEIKNEKNESLERKSNLFTSQGRRGAGSFRGHTGRQRQHYVVYNSDI